MQRIKRFPLLKRASILSYATGLVVAAFLLLVLWPQLWRNLFATGFDVHSFMPHGECYFWVPQLWIMHFSSDLLIGLSYVAISFTLAYLVYRARRDIPFHWIFLAFGLFIIACGSTHFMEVYTIWHATYWLSGYLKLVTAAASVATAIVLPPLVPKTLALVRSAKLSEERRAQLEIANRELEKVYTKGKENLSGSRRTGDAEAENKTQAERVLEVLRDSEERYRHLADAMPQIVWTADPDGALDYYNQRWFDYTGMTLEQTMGWGWQPVLHPDDLENCLKRWATCVQTGENYHIEYRFKRAADGSFRWHLGRGVPMRDESGRIIKWFGTSTDIHDQKMSEEELRNSNRVKDEFLATLSHELRTPLTPIIGWTHMIRSGMLPVENTEHGLAVIDKNAHTLTNLINDLLDMSAILSGKIRFENGPTSLNAVVREAMETLRPQAAIRNVQIEESFCDSTQPVMINGDKTRLVQIFWNLLHNAVKFSQDGGRIRISCEIDASVAHIHIADDGLGINAEFLPFIFERFRQADGSKTRQHGGLGIGLALVKSFVEAHGGTVSATSAGEGQGSRFTVSLPRLPEAVEAATAAIESTTEPAQNQQAARVLVVEDASDTLSMLGILLEKDGYRPTLCETAPEALRIAAGESFDLVISDVGLPEMDGYEFIKELRALPHMKNVPALAMTGFATQKDAERALSAGFDEHLPKPVDPNELMTRIEQLLQMKSDK